MNNIELLKLLNDVDERFLIEKYNPGIHRESVKNFKKIIKNRKLQYILTPAVTCAIALACIVVINNNKNKNKLEIAEVNELGTKNYNNCADKIIFNDINAVEDKERADIDGRFEEKDLTEQFEFLKNLDIPEYISKGRQGEMYVKENLKDVEYTKLRQYCLYYSSYEKDRPSASIDIVFTKEKTILDDCINPDGTEDKMPSSIINGKEIKLFKAECPYEKGKISGIAIFEIDEYKIHVEVRKLSEGEFINLIKSMIN